MLTKLIHSGMDLSRYLGEWILIFENRIIAHDKNIKNIEQQIKNCKGTPTVMKIPKEDTWIF